MLKDRCLGSKVTQNVHTLLIPITAPGTNFPKRRKVFSVLTLSRVILTTLPFLRMYVPLDILYITSMSLTSFNMSFPPPTGTGELSTPGRFYLTLFLNTGTPSRSISTFNNVTTFVHYVVLPLIGRRHLHILHPNVVRPALRSNNSAVTCSPFMTKMSMVVILLNKPLPQLHHNARTASALMINHTICSLVKIRTSLSSARHT